MKIHLRFGSLIALIATLSLSGCLINTYSLNYRDIKSTMPPSVLQMIRTPSSPPQVITVDDIYSVEKQYISRGYILLGYTHLVAPATGVKAIADYDCKLLGKKVGADVVLLSIICGQPQQGVMALPTYQPGVNLTATTMGNASVIGGGGPYYGSYGQTTVITSPGTFGTQLVPTTYQPYIHDVACLALKKPEFLTPQQRALGQ